jgi:CubicO group peptidase (beta-lactamase class C family)
MSSGVNFSEDYKGTDDLSKMWHRCMEESQQSLDDYARLLTRAEAPGKRFYYRSIDTQVLAWLVNRAAGEHPAQYLSRKIWQPAGMEQDATWLVDGSGMEAGFCCLQATLRDYGRFGLIFLNRGKSNGKQIVPAEWVRQATTPGAPQVQPGKLMRGSTQGYQYQWWTFPGGENHPFAAEGVFFQYVYVRPADNMVIVKTTAFDDFWNDEVEKETYAVFDAIASAAK